MTTQANVLFEELIEDTKRLTQSVIQWGDRWSKYGEELAEQASESQRREIEEVIGAFIKAVETLGS